MKDEQLNVTKTTHLIQALVKEKQRTKAILGISISNTNKTRVRITEAGLRSVMTPALWRWEDLQEQFDKSDTILVAWQWRASYTFAGITFTTAFTSKAKAQIMKEIGEINNE